MPDGRHRRRREPLAHVVAALAGGGVALAIVGVWSWTLVWRSAAVAVALTLLLRAFASLIVLGRAEWRREHPSVRHYAGPVARCLAAFLLIVLSTA